MSRPSPGAPSSPGATQRRSAPAPRPLPLDELRSILASMKTLHKHLRHRHPRPRHPRHRDPDLLSRPPRGRPRPTLRPLVRPLIIGVDIDRNTRRERISRRLDQRLAAGMVDEVRALIDSGVDPTSLSATVSNTGLSPATCSAPYRLPRCGGSSKQPSISLPSGR